MDNVANSCIIESKTVVAGEEEVGKDGDVQVEAYRLPLEAKKFRGPDVPSGEHSRQRRGACSQAAEGVDLSVVAAERGD